MNIECHVHGGGEQRRESRHDHNALSFFFLSFRAVFSKPPTHSPVHNSRAYPERDIAVRFHHLVSRLSLFLSLLLCVCHRHTQRQARRKSDAHAQTPRPRPPTPRFFFPPFPPLSFAVRVSCS